MLLSPYTPSTLLEKSTTAKVVLIIRHIMNDSVIYTDIYMQWNYMIWIMNY